MNLWIWAHFRLWICCLLQSKLSFRCGWQKVHAWKRMSSLYKVGNLRAGKRTIWSQTEKPHCKSAMLLIFAKRTAQVLICICLKRPWHFAVRILADSCTTWQGIPSLLSSFSALERYVLLSNFNLHKTLAQRHGGVEKEKDNFCLLASDSVNYQFYWCF